MTQQRTITFTNHINQIHTDGTNINNSGEHSIYEAVIILQIFVLVSDIAIRRDLSRASATSSCAGSGSGSRSSAGGSASIMRLLRLQGIANSLAIIISDVHVDSRLGGTQGTVALSSGA
jgi:hypothetical protein